MTKIIKILNDCGYKVVVGKEYINLEDSYELFIIYDKDDRTVQLCRKGNVYIMEKFIQLIAEIEKEQL